MPIKLDHNTRAHIRLGSLVSGAVALVTATIFVWQIKQNGETALSEIRDVKARLECMETQHRRLWWEHHPEVTKEGQAKPAVIP